MSADSRIVTEWIRLQRAPEGSAEFELLFPVYDEVCVLVEEAPEQAWQFILEALRVSDSTAVMETLAAGPLEDLLVHHGARLIDRVEEEARRNPRFAFLLGGVWAGRLSGDLWKRIEAVRDRRGWDGVPRE